MRLKFQKRSELKFVSRTIPHSGGYKTPQLAAGIIPVVDAGGGDDEVYGGNIIRFRKKIKHQNTWRRFSQQENLRRAA